MGRLKSKLLSLNANKTNKVLVYNPRNCEELRIPFKADKVAKVVGKLASIPPPISDARGAGVQEPQLITGVLVQNDFKMSLMAPEDLREYAGLTTTTIVCKQRLKLSAAGVDLIKWALEGTFGSIDELPGTKPSAPEHAGTNGNAGDELVKQDADADDVVAAYLVMDCVTVRYHSGGEVELEWEGNMLNDGIADAIMFVLMNVESSPAAVKRRSLPSPNKFITHPNHPQLRFREQTLPLPRRQHRKHLHPPNAQPPRQTHPGRAPRAPNDVPRSPVRRRQRIPRSRPSSLLPPTFVLTHKK
jgi:cleavage and polyadenylation specificity factor subunit 3